MNHEDDVELLQTKLKVAELIGSLMQFWGFKRSVGRLWTMLFLSPEPLGAAELGETLTMSTGAVSMTLAELVKWGAVRKTWIPGERRDFYEVETSIWKLITRVLREREMVMIRDAADTLEQAQRVLNRKLETADKVQQDRLGFLLERVTRLHRLAQLGELFVTSLISGDTVDPTEVREVAVGEKP